MTKLARFFIFALVAFSLLQCTPNTHSESVIMQPGQKHVTKAAKEIIDNFEVKMSPDSGLQLVINAELSNLYSSATKWVPKCTFLADDPSTRRFFAPISEISITAKFPSEFVGANLPENIQALLRLHHVASENLDVCFYAQFMGTLGEQIDHADGSVLTTRLRPHGWADSDAPASFSGDRVNRAMLVGLFDLDDPNMQDEVVADRLIDFNVHTHDSVMSPRNMRVKLPNRTLSQSFWSLVIDHSNPNGAPRAIATLHWLLGSDVGYFGGRPSMTGKNENELISVGNFTPTNDVGGGIYSLAPKFRTWKDLFHYFKTKDSIASQSIIKKLETLLRE